MREHMLDPLTWLPGADAFRERLAAALRAAFSSRGHLAVMVIDIDGMGRLNGLLGRELGDRVLREAASRMARALGPQVPLARLQDDDFAAFAAVEDSAAAAKLARLVLDASRSPYLLGCVTVTATVSVGTALFPKEASDTAELLRRAGAALRCAKEQGGNRYVSGATCCDGSARPPRRARA